MTGGPWYNTYIKRFFIIKHKSKHLINVPNDVRLIIHAIYKQKPGFLMECSTAISSVANTIDKLHIQSDLHFFHKNNSIVMKQLWMNCFINSIFPY